MSGAVRGRGGRGRAGLARVALLLLVAPLAAAAAPARWQDGVRAEHEARKARIAAAARDARAGTPELHEALVRRGELPAAFGVDLPVLRVVFPGQVFFDTDRDDLKPEAEAVVAAVADALKAEGDEVALFVAGHTDGRAGDGYNLDLSIRRAETVARALDALGAGRAKLWRIGFGRAVPLVPNTSDANMARNRRVEFVIAKKPEAVRAWLAKQDALVCAGTDAGTRAGCRAVLASNPRFEARAVGAGVPDAPMPVTVQVVGVRAGKPQPPTPVRVAPAEPVRVEMSLPQVLVRRPDL